MRVAVIKKELVAVGTLALYLTKPEGFSYIAGQNSDFTLIDPPETDTEGNRRTFTLASAPHESHLLIVTRLRDSAFKRSLNALGEGAQIELEGPYGSFFLHDNVKRPAVFLAGGIGITPFRSMLVDAVHKKLPHTITLLYSNRRAADAPFLTELAALQSPTFTFVPIESTEEGHIDEAKLRAHVSFDASPIFYAAGPLMMVSAMRKLLNSMGVSNDDIRSEDFAGY